ncbi:MAG: phenylalanine--tRNA ligase subunit alpha [Cyclobacteriaceae bacterium]|nr:phenylalanine--tRNA ligase subunit alpha [Cyclobacteriaceae bacterium]
MIEKVKHLKDQIKAFTASSQHEIEEFRLRFISKKGELTDLFTELKNIPAEEKKKYGQLLNELKNTARDKFQRLVDQVDDTGKSPRNDIPDITLPPSAEEIGSVHPITSTRNKIVSIFEKIGFNISEGPEIEDDWHNFTALNFPPNHPAREMQDTFFIEKEPDIALRTHTSSVQVRIMERQQPPIRTLSPGRVFRNEAISARAHCVFHQVEGLYVDKHVSFVDLKQTIYHFVKEMFGKDTKIRFRPSYFPFTEPSAEVDISCNICKGKGCNICKHSGWVEIAGSGMVDPNVLKNCNIDPEEFTGFAFGMGIERITMLKYQISDLRLFTENDLRFLKQFRHTGF